MSLTFTPVATDNFTPNANPLNPAHWTTMTDATYYGTARAQGGSFEATNTTYNNGLIAGAFYTGATFPANQYISVKLNAWALSSYDEIDFQLRSPDLTGDLGYFLAVLDNGDGTTTTIEFGYTPVGGGDSINLYENDSVIVGVGDTFVFGVIGYTLFLYNNGVLIASVVDPTQQYTAAGYLGMDVDPQNSASEIKLGTFAAGLVTESIPVPPSSNIQQFAGVRIPGMSDRDYLHLLNSAGQVIGWIDPSGKLAGSLGSAGAALPTVNAVWTIPGNASTDFIHFVVDGTIVAWIDFTGVYRTSGTPQYQAVKVLQGNPIQDFLQITDSLGDIIGWIDYTGALNGTL
jgi:hypothetical protein